MESRKANNFEHSEEDQNKILSERLAVLLKQLSIDIKELYIDSITCLEIAGPQDNIKEYRIKIKF